MHKRYIYCLFIFLFFCAFCTKRLSLAATIPPDLPLLQQAQQHVAQQWDAALHQAALVPIDRDIVVMSPRGAALHPCPSGWQWEPLNMRHWGRIHIGLKCGKETGSLVAVVHAQAPVWITTKTLNAGHRLQAQDVRQQVFPIHSVGELNADLPWHDRVVRKPVAAGTALRTQHLALPVYARKGEKVEIRAHMDGITVSMAGISARTAHAGETLRVRNLSTQQWVTGRLIAPGVLEPTEPAEGGVKVQLQSSD